MVHGIGFTHIIDIGLLYIYEYIHILYTYIFIYEYILYVQYIYIIRYWGL